VLADQSNNAGGHAGKFAGKFEGVDRAETAGAGIVVPGNAKEVERIDGVEVDRAQLPDDDGIDRRRVAQLREGRDQHTAVTAGFDGAAARVISSHGATEWIGQGNRPSVGYCPRKLVPQDNA
jgi:hypothetical protein